MHPFSGSAKNPKKAFDTKLGMGILPNLAFDRRVNSVGGGKSNSAAGVMPAGLNNMNLTRLNRIKRIG
jgi:hypothetical protein